MFTVNTEYLPTAENAKEDMGFMSEFLTEVELEAHLIGLNFVGNVFSDTAEADQFEVLVYSGLIKAITANPPSFVLSVREAWRQIDACDCPYESADEIFEDFDLVMQKAELSMDLDELAGVPTEDPHYETLHHLIGADVTVAFDRLGAFGMNGIVDWEYIKQSER